VVSNWPNTGEDVAVHGAWMRNHLPVTFLPSCLFKNRSDDKLYPKKKKNQVQRTLPNGSPKQNTVAAGLVAGRAGIYI
jgi:hypothetical protein